MKEKEVVFSRTIKEHRRIIERLRPSILCADDVLITDEPEIRIYRKTSSRGELVPTIFFLQGTGFVARETALTDLACSHICAASNSQIICIKHKLAPEYQFPAGPLDAYRILKKIIRQSTNHKIDQTKLAIMGYSSGGNFAALLTMWAKNDGIHFLKQVLISPGLDLSASIPDFKNEEKQDKLLSHGFKEWAYKHYIPVGKDPHDPDISPVWMDEKYLHDLPPTDIIIADHDCCRGDGELYYKKLTRALVETTRTEMPGYHDYFYINLEVSKFIGLRMKYVFSQQDIEHPLIYNNNLMSMITIDKKDHKLIIQMHNSNSDVRTLSIKQLQKLFQAPLQAKARTHLIQAM